MNPKCKIIFFFFFFPLRKVQMAWQYSKICWETKANAQQVLQCII